MPLDSTSRDSAIRIENGESVRWRLRLILACAVAVTVLVLLCCLPLPYNPDGNSYLGMALRLSRLDLIGAGHLMHSPMLSLLLVPGFLLHIAPSVAFQVVSALILASSFLALSWLGRACGLSERLAIGTALISVVQLLPVSLFLLTPDLLVIPMFCLVLFSWFRFERTGGACDALILGAVVGACYLTKALDLPILAVFLSCAWLLHSQRSGPVTWRAFTLFLVGLAVVAGPWMALVSFKAGTFLISGQSWIVNRVFELSAYHPDLSPERLAALKRELPWIAALQQMPSRAAMQLMPTVREILDQLFSLIVGAETALMYIGALFLAASRRGENALYNHRKRLLLIYSLIRCIIYLLVGDAYLRFYLPVIPLINIYVVDAAVAVWNQGSSSVRIPRVLIGFALLGLLLITPIRTVYELSRMVTPSWVQRALDLPELNAERGPLIGNLEHPLTGYVAYALGRESWGYLTKAEISGGHAGLKLKEWGITQVLWIGEVPRELSCLSCLTLTHSVSDKETLLSLFSVNRQLSACECRPEKVERGG